MTDNCKSEIMPEGHFDNDAFFAALDSQRMARKVTWKKVAEESTVSASTLTRIAQGKRPDVDSLGALCSWASLTANDFFLSKPENISHTLEPLAQVTTYLRADPNLSKEGAQALEALLKTAYERLRKG
jgi:transcriptional regulator with XRE-family HTH domain